jgi:hypothetical protein
MNIQNMHIPRCGDCNIERTKRSNQETNLTNMKNKVIINEILIEVYCNKQDGPIDEEKVKMREGEEVPKIK